MKKYHKLFTFFTIAVLLICLFLTSCAKVEKPSDLESLLKSNEEVAQKLQDAAASTGLDCKLDVKGNDVYLSYDLSALGDVEEEILKSDEMKEKLSNGLNEFEPQLKSACKSIEESAEIGGIKITVEFKYGDEILASKTFTSAE